MKKLNINEVLWYMILLGFTFFFYFLIYTDRINLFINPKLVKFTIFALVVFMVLTLFQSVKIFSNSNNHGKIRKGYLLFCIPLLMSFFVNPKNLNADIIFHNNGMHIFGHEYKLCDEHNGDYHTECEHGIEESNVFSVDKENNIIKVNHNNFYSAGEEIQREREEFNNKKISVSGFVFKNKNLNLKNNQFVLARISILCCAADSEIVGFLCESDEAYNYNEGQWVEIIANVGTERSKDENIFRTVNKENSDNILLLTVEDIKSIEKPENSYIYR